MVQSCKATPSCLKTDLNDIQNLQKRKSALKSCRTVMDHKHKYIGNKKLRTFVFMNQTSHPKNDPRVI